MSHSWSKQISLLVQADCGDRSPTEEEEGSGYIWCSPPKQERPWKRKNIEERQKNIVIEIVTVIL